MYFVNMLRVRLVWLGSTSVDYVMHNQVVQISDVLTKFTVNEFLHFVVLIVLCVGYPFVVLGYFLAHLFRDGGQFLLVSLDSLEIFDEAAKSLCFQAFKYGISMEPRVAQQFLIFSSEELFCLEDLGDITAHTPLL